MSLAKRNIHKIRKTNEKVSVIILAAGMGTRIKSFGVRSLIRLHTGRTVIDHQLDLINSVFSNNEIILVTGFEADKLMNKTPSNIIKVENERFESTNVTRSLSLGLRAATTDNVVIVYGDLVFNSAALDFPLDKSCLLIDESGTMDSEIGTNIDNNLVELLLYGLNNKWGQICFVRGKELELMKSIVWNRDNENKFGFEILNEIIDRNGSFRSYKNPEAKMLDIDSGKDLERTKSIL
jgi:CTP:phosphocholine cytidylyltransferase-like protein